MTKETCHSLDTEANQNSTDSINITAGALPRALILDGSINSRPGSPRGCIAGSDGGSVQRCDLMP
jgi:hypothetical protein